MVATLKQQVVMASTSGAIAGALDGLSRKIKVLDEEIKTAKEGEADFQRQIRRLETKKRELQNSVNTNEEWLKGYETSIGPFQQKYEVLVAELTALYGDAKDSHAKGTSPLALISISIHLSIYPPLNISTSIF